MIRGQRPAWSWPTRLHSHLPPDRANARSLVLSEKATGKSLSLRDYPAPLGRAVRAGRPRSHGVALFHAGNPGLSWRVGKTSSPPLASPHPSRGTGQATGVLRSSHQPPCRVAGPCGSTGLAQDHENVADAVRGMPRVACLKAGPGAPKPLRWEIATTGRTRCQQQTSSKPHASTGRAPTSAIGRPR